MTVASKFEYDPTQPLNVRPIGQQDEGGVKLSSLTYQTPFGYRRAAYLLRPSEDAAGDQAAGLAAILYVHWLETWHPTANRRQFLDEAREMARRGAVCLLVETMWSDQDWFVKRSLEDDEESSIRQAIELRRAMDLLLSQPGVDAGRFAYVGHDFGGMYGVLAGSVDRRPACYVVMASTPRLSDWFLYYPPIADEDRQAYIARISPYDPIHHIANLAPAPVLFQFGKDDQHVPVERAQEFYDAAAQPKEVCWYECGHGLNEAAGAERVAWVGRQLGL